MGIPWYENLIWEKEHQDFLKGLYREQLTGAVFVRPVRRIISGGCGCVFYTQVHSKKCCSWQCMRPAQMNRGKRIRLERRQNTVCECCGKEFTPARYGAKYCSNACRQKAYRNRNVTNVVSHQNEVLP